RVGGIAVQVLLEEALDHERVEVKDAAVLSQAAEEPQPIALQAARGLDTDLKTDAWLPGSDLGKSLAHARMASRRVVEAGAVAKDATSVIEEAEVGVAFASIDAQVDRTQRSLLVGRATGSPGGEEVWLTLVNARYGMIP